MTISVEASRFTPSRPADAGVHEVSHAEMTYSREMIARSQKRLAYQRTIVAKLRFDSESHYADLVRDIEATMAAKLALLVKRHASLVVVKRPEDRSTRYRFRACDGSREQLGAP